MKVSLFKVGESVEVWRVLLNFTILGIALLVVEPALHSLEACSKRYPKYHEMVSKVYRELMILGLLGLGLKLAGEAHLVDDSSPEMVAFICADLTIFILVIALILQSVCIFLQLWRKNKEYDTIELLTTENVHQMALQHEHRLAATRNLLKSWWISTKYDELIEMRFLRHFFLQTHHLPELFPFAKYLRQAQDDQISHMIDVDASMWLLVFLISWLWYLLARMMAGSAFDDDNSFDSISIDEPSNELSSTHRMHVAMTLAFIIFSWLLTVTHVCTLTYLLWCIKNLLYRDGLESKTKMLERLLQIANEETSRLGSEVTSDAIKRMENVQEQQQVHQHKTRSKWTRDDTGCQLLVTIYRNLWGKRRNRHCAHAAETQAPSSAMTSSTGRVEIRWFSRKAWHFQIKLLLILNALYFALFVQALLYLLPEIQRDCGVLIAVMVPLPLVVNAVLLQPQILRHFVLISSICRVNVDTLSNVIDHFTQTVNQQSSFIATVHNCLQERGKSIHELEDLFATHDKNQSGWIDVEDMRQVLATVGYHMSFFRFNAMLRLVFQLEHGRVDYRKVITLLLLAEDNYDELYEGSLLIPEKTYSASIDSLSAMNRTHRIGPSQMKLSMDEMLQRPSRVTKRLTNPTLYARGSHHSHHSHPSMNPYSSSQASSWHQSHLIYTSASVFEPGFATVTTGEQQDHTLTYLRM